MEGETVKIPCRLAAFDLDGTLLSSDHTLSPENREALRAISSERYSRRISIGKDAPFYSTYQRSDRA